MNIIWKRCPCVSHTGLLKSIWQHLKLPKGDWRRDGKEWRTEKATDYAIIEKLYRKEINIDTGDILFYPVCPYHESTESVEYQGGNVLRDDFKRLQTCEDSIFDLNAQR